jgi:hypothetical protein
LPEIKGGEELERALNEIGQKLAEKPSLRVGFLEKARYPDGTLVAAVAAFNEFGTSKSPARPFFRGMVKEKSKTWAPAIAENLKRTNYDATKTLEIVGMGIKGQLQDAIRNFQGAPLSPRTIARKGFDKQLIDSSQMLKSVDYDVKSK